MAAERQSLRWPLGLAATLALGICASLAFLWVASRRPPERLPVDTWTAGAELNESLRAQALAARRGWSLELRARRSPAGARVELVPATSGESLPDDLSVALRRERPERTDFDGEITLRRDAGRWVADVALPLSGRWLLVARGRRRRFRRASVRARGDSVSASLGEASFSLGGLRCAGCALRVERELRGAPGVSDAAVNFATERALVRFDPGVTDAPTLCARVESLGYRASHCEVARDVVACDEARAALARLLVAAFLAGNVMVISFALYFGALQDIERGLRAALRWLALALSLPALTWCALPFWRGAWHGLRRRELTLDVPIVVGTTTAFGASAVGTWAGARDVFSDSASTIVFLMLLGRALERGARARASDAVERLAARAPRGALRRGPGGVESVRADALAPGDRVVVPAGQTFPADGRLLADAAEVDESLLCGESRPVARAAGDTVRCGTVNLASEVEIEVTHGPASGTVARLVGLLERAQAERPPLQLAVDRVAQVFAPAVLGLAGVAALGHWLGGAPALDAALRAAAVLIVACPCALGLATPTAVSAALGRAAALGLWFKAAQRSSGPRGSTGPCSTRRAR